jgi:hypothetical protein
MKKRLFPFLIALSALAISGSAAFYSVTGLSKLFIGASLEVIIMASALEFSKLVIASLLYQYWDTINKTLRTYLTIATTILILITSMGIYGFLTGAYQKSATELSIVESKLATLESKKELYASNRETILKEKEHLAELRGALAKGSITQYTDKKGNLVVKSNKVTMNSIESISKSDDKLSDKLETVNDSIFNIESKMLEIKNNSKQTSELGPLKYLSDLTGKPMDKIINWLVLTIIFVFDPLAIALVIAANFAFAQIKEQPIFIPEPIEPKEEPVVEEPIVEEPIITTEQPIDPVRVEEDRLLNNQSISQWRKNKILRNRTDNDEGEIKTY